MRCVGIPEAIWTGSIADLKKTDTDIWTTIFLARKGLAGCTDVSEAFHQAKLYLDGDPKDVKEMIEHSDISMTDRYSHLTLNHHKAIQENLAKHYENTAN